MSKFDSKSFKGVGRVSVSGSNNSYGGNLFRDVVRNRGISEDETRILGRAFNPPGKGLEGFTLSAVADGTTILIARGTIVNGKWIVTFADKAISPFTAERGNTRRNAKVPMSDENRDQGVDLYSVVNRTARLAGLIDGEIDSQAVENNRVIDALTQALLDKGFTQEEIDKIKKG